MDSGRWKKEGRPRCAGGVFGSSPAAEQRIHRTPHCPPATLQHVGIDLRQPLRYPKPPPVHDCYQPVAFPHAPQNGRDLLAHLSWAPLAGKDEADPIDVGLFGAVAVMQPSWDVMRRMRRNTSYHAHPPHNIPRERMGSGHKTLNLKMMLRRTPVDAGYYAALRSSICC